MKRLPFLITMGLLFVLSSCGLLIFLGSTPAPWAVAMNIECLEIMVKGSDDDQYTTVTQSGTTGTTASFDVEGDIRVLPAAMGADIFLQSADDVYNNTIYSDDVSGDGNWKIVFGPSGAGSMAIYRTSGIGYTSVLSFDQADGEAHFANAVDILADMLEIAGVAVTTTAAELNFLDGAIAGTAIVGKAVVLAADKDIDTLSIDKGGFKIDASAVTTIAAELNFNDGSIAGTAVASKTLVLGANKNIDTLVIADSGLKLGADAGTTVTSTAAELNLLDGSVAGTAVASKAAVLGALKDLDYLAITGGAGADLEVAGEIYAEGMFYAISGVTTSQDVGTTHTFISVNTSGGTVTLTLPDRGSGNNGRVYFFKKIHADNTLTIDGYGDDTVDGAASFSATADDAYLQIIGADTDGWMIIGNKDFS